MSTPSQEDTVPFQFSADDESSSKKVWSFDDTASISDAEIQEELRATYNQKEIKVNNTFIMEIPKINLIDDTYEKFLSFKIFSFLLLSTHPYFRGKIDPADQQKLYALKKQRSRLETVAMFSTTFSLATFNTFMESKNPIIALTANSSSFRYGVIFYGIVPMIVASTVDKYYLVPRLYKQSTPIFQKYNYYDEAPQNPYFQKAYNHLLQFARDNFNDTPNIKRNQTENAVSNESSKQLSQQEHKQ